MTNEQKRSILHLYVDDHRVNDARHLLQDENFRMKFLNFQDAEGFSPLHLACMNGDEEMVKLLCEHGADVHLLDRDAHSVIHWITVCGHVHLFDILLQYNAPIHTADHHHAYPIHYAAQLSTLSHNHDGIIIDAEKASKILIKLIDAKADLHCLDKQERTPFIWGANVGANDALKLLYQHGSDSRHKDKESLTALHCAVTSGHTSTVQWLIEKCHCEIEAKDINGCTPLFYAVTFNRIDIVRLLLNFKANVNHQDNRGRSPCHCAISKGNLDCLKELIHFNGNFYLKNKRGDYPTHEAIRQRSNKSEQNQFESKIFDVLRYVFHLYPKSIHLRNNDNQTVLHLAASLGQIATCELLIECGARLHSLVRTSNVTGEFSNFYQTSLDLALNAKENSCADFLRFQYGAQTGDVIAKIFARRIQKFYRNYRSKKNLVQQERKTKNPLVKQSEICQENDNAHERRRIFAKSRTTLKPIDQNDESKVIIHSSNSSSTFRKLSLRRQLIAEALTKLQKAQLHNQYIVINRALYKILIENAFNPQTHRAEEIERYLETLLKAYDAELEAIRKRTQSVPPKLTRRPSQWY